MCCVGSPTKQASRVSPVLTPPPATATDPFAPHEAGGHESRLDIGFLLLLQLVLLLLLVVVVGTGRAAVAAAAAAADSLQQGGAREPPRKPPARVVKGRPRAPSQTQAGRREVPLRERCRHGRRSGRCRKEEGGQGGL